MPDPKFSTGAECKITKVHCMAESFLAEAESCEEGSRGLFSWGWNEHGNLGVGDKVDRHAPTEVPFLLSSVPSVR